MAKFKMEWRYIIDPQSPFYYNYGKHTMLIMVFWVIHQNNTERNFSFFQVTLIDDISPSLLKVTLYILDCQNHTCKKCTIK